MKSSLLILPLISLVGCASLSSYQEARVVAPGKAQMTLGMTGLSDGLVRPIVTPENTEDTLDGISMYTAELMFRFGIVKGLDLGYKATFPFGQHLDLKYQIVGRESDARFQLSLGAKAGISMFELAKPKLEEDKHTMVVDVGAPLYLTYLPTDWAAITLAPQYIHRIGDIPEVEGELVGANIGVRLGDKTGVRGEFGMHRNLNNGYNLLNYGAVFYTPVDLWTALGFLFGGGNSRNDRFW